MIKSDVDSDELGMTYVHLTEVVPPDTDIAPGDASPEESSARVTTNCSIMLQGIKLYHSLWEVVVDQGNHSNNIRWEININYTIVREKPDVQQLVRCK